MSENKKEKIECLIMGFPKSSLKTKITKVDLIKYLNEYSTSGKFDEALSEKLFQFLNIDDSSSFLIEHFIGGFMQFEEDISSNLAQLQQKLEEKKEEYENLISTIKTNEESCANSKVYGEITDIDLKRKLKGINEIILKVVFNDKNEEFHFKLGEEENIESNEPKKFEFKPSSRNDHFEFIMQGLNNKNTIFDIGSKVFSLAEVKNPEEYLVQIIIPEIDDEKKVAAYINAKIVLTWNDKNYEKKKVKLESKIEKVKIAIYKATDYLRKLREIYEKLKIKKNTKKKKKQDLEVYFNYQKTETRKYKYTVEFNNEKEIVQVQEIQKQEKEEINKEPKDEEIEKEEESDNEIEKEKEDNDIKDEEIMDDDMKDNEVNNDEPEDDENQAEENEKKEAEKKKEEKKEDKIIKVEINEEKKIENNIKEEEKNIKEEINDIKKRKEIKKEEIPIKDGKNEANIKTEIKEEKMHNQQIIKEAIDELIEQEPLITKKEVYDEINNNQIAQHDEINIYQTKQYNETTNSNPQYDFNLYANSNTYEKAVNQKEEFIDINIDDYIKSNINNNTNYQEYQTNTYENANTNLITEHNMNKNINKDITTSSTLPVIVRKNVHKVIYDSYVKTLPVIYGGTKVTYLKNKQPTNYNITNNITQSNIPLSNTQILTTTQELPTQVHNQINQVSTTTQVNPIQTYNYTQTNTKIENELNLTNLSQSQSITQEYPVQTYTNNAQSYIQENPVQKYNEANSYNIPLSTNQTYSQTQTQSYIQEKPIHTYNQVPTEIQVNTKPIYSQTLTQTQTYSKEIPIQSYTQTYNQTQNHIQVNPVQAFNYSQTSQAYTTENLTQNFNNQQNYTNVNNSQVFSKIETYTLENPKINFSFAQNYTKENPVQTYSQISNYNQENINQSFGPINLSQSYNLVNQSEDDQKNKEEETDIRLLSIVRNYNPVFDQNNSQIEGINYGSLQPEFNQNSNFDEYKKTGY